MKEVDVLATNRKRQGIVVDLVGAALPDRVDVAYRRHPDLSSLFLGVECPRDELAASQHQPQRLWKTFLDRQSTKIEAAVPR